MSKLADRLLSQLSQPEKTYEDFWNEYGLIIKEKKPEQFWKKAFEKTTIPKNTIINRADISYTYFYDILKGKKHPSRDILIKICIAMELPVKTCQKALAVYDWAPLTATIHRDSIILYAITHNLNLNETQELLESHSLKALW